MSREILEAMHALAREKGIEPEKLMMALEDALLSAYKKQPGSAKYARVEMDHETADFRVIELKIPERLEAHLIVETIDEETTIDPETGERRDPELIKKLFELEVPEIADGLVEIANVAREPGYRSKIAVISHADGVDPVGACVGPRGSRVRMVVSELRGEKIDIIPFNDEPARFVAKALSPARVREVLVDDDAKQATVIVPDDQLSLAIGREGQNARLAARLTGWRVDIRSETEFAAEEAEHAYEEEEVQGRCAAILSNGRRCPNAALPGSRYCGLETHQALAAIDGDKVTDLAAAAPADAAAASAAPGEPEPAPVQGAAQHAPAASAPAAEPEASSAPRAEAETAGEAADAAAGEGAEGPEPAGADGPELAHAQLAPDEAPGADGGEHVGAQAARKAAEGQST